MKDYSKDMLLSDFLDNWFIDYAKPYVKPSTAVSYEGYIRNHIKPYIGDKKLSELNQIALQKFFSKKYEGGARCDGKKGGLSEKTVRNLKNMLHEAFKMAYDNDLITKNYVSSIKLRKCPIPKISIFTHEEQNLLFEKLINEKNDFIFGIQLCFMLGIRLGEMCGLKWSDINFLTHSVFIERTLARIPDLDSGSSKKTKIIIDTPKSEKSIRRIPFNIEVLNLISKHREYSEKKYGKGILADDQFVINHGYNTFVEPHALADEYKKICKIAKIPVYKFHTLRHTFASRCIELGMDFKMLSEILGHSSITVTIDRYGHILDDTKDAVVNDVLSRFFDYSQNTKPPQKDKNCNSDENKSDK